MKHNFVKGASPLEEKCSVDKGEGHWNSPGATMADTFHTPENASCILKTVVAEGVK